MSDVTFGVAKTGVQEVLALVLDHLPHLSTAMIRGLDSTRDSEALRKILDDANVSYQMHGINIWLTRTSVKRLLHNGFFTGFDEVWLLDSVYPSLVMAPSLALTSDGVRFTDNLPRQLTEALKEIRRYAVVADGLGLNYVTNDATAASILSSFPDSCVQ